MSLVLFIVLPALAGYGDVGDDGYPVAEERALHLWTNAARVAPEEFEADYSAGGCSTKDFSDDELTAKDPVYYNRDLNEAARYHSEDMDSTGVLTHDSSDGTSFEERIARYYDSGAGENIAQGYGDACSVVFEGWMCSTEGHRENIMSSSWHELGTGVAGSFHTQDFGAGAAGTDSAVAMGVHWPVHSTGDADFYVDWNDDAEPVDFDLVLNGEPIALDLQWGAPERGIYTAEVEPDEADCYEYFFRWETADGTQGAFPESGSYLYGGHCDSDIMWVEGQAGEEDGHSGDDEIKVVGCSAAGRVLGWTWALGLLALVTRRR